MRVLVAVISILGIGYVAICCWLYFRQSSLVFFPNKILEATPENYNLLYENLDLETANGLRLHGWLVSADSPPLATILFCHGNGGNISHRLDIIALWRSLGYDVLAFDYQGYGQSEGAPSEAATYADVRACWDYLTLEKGVAPEKIVLLGRSLGGAVASHLTADLSLAGLPTPAGLILEAPFTSIPDMGARLYPFLPVRLLSRITYDNQVNVANIHIPVLFIHGVDDSVVPIEMGKEVFESANQPKRFSELAGGHEDTYLVAEESYQTALQDFIGAAVTID